MSDIGLFIKQDGADLEFAGGDLVLDDGLETAVLISLFTDGRASFENLPNFNEPRRGWWGDSIADIDGDLIGSELWRFYRQKITSETANAIKKICLDALEWLRTDGVASSLEVETAIVGLYEIEIQIRITRPDATNQRFSFAWDGQALRR